jgi:hypothetical protein
MKGFLNCNFGSKSSKRLAGILMILQKDWQEY